MGLVERLGKRQHRGTPYLPEGWVKLPAGGRGQDAVGSQRDVGVVSDSGPERDVGSGAQ